MPTLPLLLALTAAVMHAAWNLFLKDSEDRISVVTLLGLIGGLLYLPWVLAVEGLPTGVWDHVLASAAIHATYYLFLAIAYSRIDFSVAYPVARGVAPLLVALGGWVFLGDHVGAGEWVAIAVIAAALIGLAWTSDVWDGLPWAVGTGVAIAIYTIIDAAAARETGEALTYTVTLTALSSLFLLPVALRHRGLSGLVAAARTRPVALGGAALLNIGAYALVLIAATRAPVGMVAAVRESSVVIGAVAGVVLLSEPFGRRRVVGAAAVAAGVVLLGLM